MCYEFGVLLTPHFLQCRKGGRIDKHFDVGACVLAKNFNTSRCWLEGTILGASGPKSYQIELTDGCVIRWHVNHVRHGFLLSSPLLTEID